jgi:hypothetical protein
VVLLGAIEFMRQSPELTIAVVLHFHRPKIQKDTALPQKFVAS